MDDETFPVVCENGCPEGYLGRHKFSCRWARHDFDAGPLFPEVRVKLTGEDGNIYFIIGRVRAALREAGHSDQRDYFSRHVMAAQSYPEALATVRKWVSTS